MVYIWYSSTFPRRNISKQQRSKPNPNIKTCVSLFNSLVMVLDIHVHVDRRINNKLSYLTDICSN